MKASVWAAQVRILARLVEHPVVGAVKRARRYWPLHRLSSFVRSCDRRPTSIMGDDNIGAQAVAGQPPPQHLPNLDHPHLPIGHIASFGRPVWPGSGRAGGGGMVLKSGGKFLKNSAANGGMIQKNDTPASACSLITRLAQIQITSRILFSQPPTIYLSPRLHQFLDHRVLRGVLALRVPGPRQLRFDPAHTRSGFRGPPSLRSGLSPTVPKNLDEPRGHLRRSIRRIQRSQTLLWSCV